MSRGPIWNQTTQPSVSAMDFDPATYDPAQDVEDDGEDTGEGAKVELSSVEINILIYLVSGSPTSLMTASFASQHRCSSRSAQRTDSRAVPPRIKPLPYRLCPLIRNSAHVDLALPLFQPTLPLSVVFQR